jgi:hypothetical protein
MQQLTATSCSHTLCARATPASASWCPSVTVHHLLPQHGAKSARSPGRGMRTRHSTLGRLAALPHHVGWVAMQLAQETLPPKSSGPGGEATKACTAERYGTGSQGRQTGRQAGRQAGRGGHDFVSAQLARRGSVALARADAALQWEGPQRGSAAFPRTDRKECGEKSSAPV